MLKYTGIEKETFIRLRGKEMKPGIYCEPGKTYEYEGWIEEALLESGKFKVVHVKKMVQEKESEKMINPQKSKE